MFKTYGKRSLEPTLVAFMSKSVDVSLDESILLADLSKQSQRAESTELA